MTNTYRYILVSKTILSDICLLLRYYSPKELEDQGVKHVKILTEGRVVPSEGVVHQFYRAVEGTEHGLIGVHCTHGLNRTGYLICRCLSTPDVSGGYILSAQIHD